MALERVAISEAEGGFELDAAGILHPGRGHEVRRPHVAPVAGADDAGQRILRAPRDRDLEAVVPGVAAEVLVAASPTATTTLEAAAREAAALTLLELPLREV